MSRFISGELRFGIWSGCPKGVPEDKTRCIEEVWGKWLPHQCQRKRGHGLDGLYCKQHAKKHQEERGAND